jgi:hypothetical protein
MSIEDPAVLAGITEGIPFFVEPGSTATSMGMEGIEGIDGIESYSAPVGASSVSPQPPAAAAGGAVPNSVESAVAARQRHQGPHASPSRLLSSYNLTPPLTQRPSTSSGMLPSLPSISGPGDTPSKEAETRELREFWKQYMSTPLTGPGSGSGATPMEFAPAMTLASGGSGGPNTPGRRPRGNSLPSISTPTTQGGQFLPSQQQQGHVAVNGYVRGQGGFTLQPPPGLLKPSTSNSSSTKPPAQSQGLAMATPLPQNASGMRTTLHGNPDDLRSYEAAVLARKPVSLYLAPKVRKATAPAAPGSTNGDNKNGNNSGLPQPPLSPSRLRSASVSGGGHGVHHEGMPPPKSTSSPRRSVVADDRGFSSASSSSLISAFGAGGGHSRDSSVTSLSSVDSASCIPNSSELDAASTAPTRGGSLVPSLSGTPSQPSASKFALSPASWRPSFKRLASQTLEQPGDPKKFFGAGSLETPRGEINNPYDSFASGGDWSAYRHEYEKEESEDSAYGGEDGEDGDDGEENGSDEYDASNSGSGSGSGGTGSGSGSGEAGYGTPSHVPELGGVRVIELAQ